VSSSTDQILELEGVVYTSVFNPLDGRKNWEDMVSAFCWAFREVSDVTLLLKLVHTDIDFAIERLQEFLYRMTPFKCRVVAIHGYLSDEDYARMIEATSFYVNTAHGEGQCLPLLEFLSSGVPAIAPKATALADYIDADVAFVVRTSREPASWQHDPRQVLRALQNRIDWESLERAYRASYSLVKSNEDAYRAMARNAVARIEQLCSRKVAEEKLRSFLASSRVMEMLERRRSSSAVLPGLAGSPPAEGARLTRILERNLLGWYDPNTGALAPGVEIRPEDVVLIVGCDETEPAEFSLGRGAHVVIADPSARRVRELAEQLGAGLGAGSGERVRSLVCDPGCIPAEDALATRVVCMGVLDRCEDPNLALRELVRLGQPGALYLLAVSDSRGAGFTEVPSEAAPSTRNAFAPGDLARLLAGVGLTIEAELTQGFFWTVGMGIRRAEGGEPFDDLEPEQASNSFEMPDPPVLRSWAKTWRQFLSLPNAEAIQRKLDALLPCAQVIVARKRA